MTLQSCIKKLSLLYCTMSLRIQDSKAENEVSKFLDKYFYPKFYNNNERVFDKSNQLNGIDIIVDIPEIGRVNVDEKAAVHYVNKGIPTFAFEVDFRLSSGELVDGWFYSKTKLTQYYLLIWVWADKDKGFVCDDISKLEVVLINRFKIHSELMKYGLSEISIQEVSKSIRESNISGVSQKDFTKPFYYYLTTHLSENPLNIILKKDFLIKNCIHHSFVLRP